VVKHLGPPGADEYVLAQSANGCQAASYALFTGGENLVFYVYDGGTFFSSPDAGPGIWDGNWHLVAGTYDGQFVRMYVDGVETGAERPLWCPLPMPWGTSNSTSARTGALVSCGSTATLMRYASSTAL
jgi:Concanavalin A-like lectin/glucanases superfamily